MRRLLFLLALLLPAGGASAQVVSVADSMTLVNQGGEVQSTVVPPDKKGQCQAGRFLVTNDRLRPPQSVVMGRDLDQTAGAPVASTFKMGTLDPNFNTGDTTKYYFGTNDHDLVTLSNGDVLYITGAFSRMPLGAVGGRPLPIWMSSLFKETFRDGACVFNAAGACTSTYSFGPDARSVVLVFRSTDCGGNFEFVGEMDPVRFAGGSCALPQFRRDWAKKGAPLITEKPYDMGGTDGQLVKVDPSNDRLYMTFQCVGYDADDKSKMAPLLDSSKKLNKTLVLASDTAGATWTSLGFISQAAWRFGVTPLANGDLLFGFNSSVLTGKKGAGGSYVFDTTGVPAPAGTFAWMGNWNFGPGAGFPDVPLTVDHGNVFGVPVVARVRDGKGVVLAFPDDFGAKGLGYRVFFYDRASKELAESDPILPAEADKANVAFHLAVSDPGAGPLLLYWTDLDGSAKKMTVRGRVVTGRGEATDDFTVSRAGGADRSFALPAKYWLGDYHTAGAYFRRSGQTVGQGPFKVEVGGQTRYDFYPVWVEANGSVRYTRVEYAERHDLVSKGPLVKVSPVQLHHLPPGRWRPEPPPVELTRIPRPARVETRDPDQRVSRPVRPGPVVVRPRP